MLAVPLVAAGALSSLGPAGFTLADDGIVPLLERWNGTTWAQAASPALPAGTTGDVTALSATSANDAWAVGFTSLDDGDATLIEHWNGSAWTVTPSP
jgi:hypothetical protein